MWPKGTILPLVESARLHRNQKHVHVQMWEKYFELVHTEVAFILPWEYDYQNEVTHELKHCKYILLSKIKTKASLFLQNL